MKDALICEPLRTPVGRYGGMFKVYRNLKPPFSPTMTTTISPALQAVNRAEFGDNSALSITIRPLNRPESPHVDAIYPLYAALRERRPRRIVSHAMQGRSCLEYQAT